MGWGGISPVCRGEIVGDGDDGGCRRLRAGRCSRAGVSLFVRLAGSGGGELLDARSPEAGAATRWLAVGLALGCPWTFASRRIEPARVSGAAAERRCRRQLGVGN